MPLATCLQAIKAQTSAAQTLQSRLPAGSVPTPGRLLAVLAILAILALAILALSNRYCGEDELTLNMLLCLDVSILRR